MLEETKSITYLKGTGSATSLEAENSVSQQPCLDSDDIEFIKLQTSEKGLTGQLQPALEKMIIGKS